MRITPIALYCVVATCCLCLTKAAAAAAAPAPVALGGQRHLFIDDMLVAKKQNVTFRVNPPTIRQPVLRDEQPWEGLSEFSSVIDDGRELKLYYSNTGDEKNGVCLATSTDGVTWNKPKLGVIEFRGSKENNIVIRGAGGGSVDYDTHDLDPQRRYKYFTCQIADDKPNTATTEGMVLYTSPDGIHFTKQEVQLLPFNADSQAMMFWDPNAKKYVCYLRGNDGDAPGSRGRKVVRGETTDPMKPWPYKPTTHPYTNDHELAFASTELTTVLRTDPKLDPDETDFYGGQVFLYPWAYKVYFAFPTTYYHYKEGRRHLALEGQGGNVGVGEIQLAVSRDGIHFTRYPRPAYIHHGWWGDSYVGWPWMIRGMVRRGEKILQYVSLRRSGHGGREYVQSRSHALDGYVLFEQPLDRFVAAEFEYTGGTMTTQPLTFEGSQLVLNVDAGATGEGRVGILDADGKPIAGFAAADCDVINRDNLEQRATWKGKADVSSLAGRPVRLRFEMRGTRLYGFQFVPEARPSSASASRP